MSMGKRGIEFTISAFDGFSGPLNDFSNKMAQSTAGLRRLAASMHGLGVSSGLAGVSQGFSKVASTGMAFASRMALIGGGIGYGFKKGFVDIASQFEDFETILETLNMGDKGKAKKEMGWISDFAAKTPYELAEVTDAFVKLRSYGLDPMHGLLETLGDTSSAMGKPLKQAVEAIADAVTGENERLKEFGIVGKKVGEKIVYEYTNASGAQVKMMAKASDRAQIQATLTKIWAEKYTGGMDKLSRNWRGLWSNAMDFIARTSMKIMSNGAFDWMKNKLSGLLTLADKMGSNGSLDAWAKQWGEKLTAGLNSAWEAATGVASALAAIGVSLSAAAIAVGGWDNLARIAVGFMAGEFILSVVQLAKSFAVLGAAMTATPLGAIAAALSLITLNFLSTSDVVTGLCQTVSLLTAAWGVLSAVFFASPIGLTVAAIGLLAFGIQKVIEYWDQLMKAFKNMVPDWVLKLLGVSNGMSGRVGATTGAMNDFGKAYVGFGGAAPGDAPRGVSSGDVVRMRPNLGTAQLQRQLNETRYTSIQRDESKVTVDFANLPRGAQVSQSGRPVDMDVRWDMGPVMPGI